jgi:alkaline phosphatase D
MIQTRRHFVRGAGAAAAGLILAPQALAVRRAPLLRGGTFDQGVASGDPTARSAVLWTHIDGIERSGAVRLEVATDHAFRHVVATQDIRTNAALGHTVKARVSGLKSHERYYYRFATATHDSPVGRFQTAAPAGSREKVRFAFVSCQEFTFGYYNAHALLAREDVDFVLNLGDYIYGDVAFPSPFGVRKDPQQEARTLDQYRGKYALYRSDSNLQAVHARFPMISCWDDHEVQNNYAGGDPQGGEVSTPFTQARKQAAYKAFFEQMPTYRYGTPNRLYHRASFGRLVDLFVLDERQYRARQPCGDTATADCPDASDGRPFLGAAQKAFAESGLRASKATWKVVANELMIMPRKTADGRFEDFDAWQGYLKDRESMLQAAKVAKDVVFVTGDVHEFIAGDVRDAAGDVVAAEIVGSSITSASNSELQALTGGGPESETARAARQAQSGWSYLDDAHHGYVVCDVSPSTFKATMKRVATIKQRSRGTVAPATFTVHHGTPGLAA